MDKIKESIFKFLRLHNIMSNLTGYLEAQVALVKIEVKEEVGRLLSKALVLMAILLLAALFLLFFSIGLAQYLNGIAESAHLGFWIIGGIYGIPCIIFLVFRKELSASFEKYFVKLIKQKEK
jgi:Putative Actinobacterial Holin-X, holin superfamily III